MVQNDRRLIMTVKKCLVLLISLAFIVGCASQQQAKKTESPAQSSAPAPAKSGTTADQKVVTPEGEMVGTPAPNSKFAKLKLGMSKKQVTDLIGFPSDQNIRPSGKAFIPFYYGEDRTETLFYYKSEGSLLFGGQKLTGIYVDKNASGYQ
jgi:hypothetical protein